MSDTVNDEQFGHLTYDPHLDWWAGVVELPDEAGSKLYTHTPEEGGKAITQQAREAFGIIAGSFDQIRQKACDERLEIHNESWNEGDPIDAETFKRRLTLESITLYPDGSAEIYFGDDDMFWGHAIIVSMSEEGGFTDAIIAG
ncbi:MAG TPA: DUF2262 domain-containing protein [Blastocatellia bacterium]|nr:DUF2262 domain-containing protein [Blastocatellia bacterium]